MSLFNKNKPDSSAIQIDTEAALKKKAANDKYINNKKVDDAFHSSIAWFIRLLPVIGILALAYTFYYYQFEAKSPESLIDLAKTGLVYIAGIVTPSVKKVLDKKDENR